MDSPLQDSLFLRLPVELRLQIYEYSVPSGTITITCSPSSARNLPSDVIDSRCIPGIPPGSDIKVARGYVEKLLVPANGLPPPAPSRTLSDSTFQELQRVVEGAQNAQGTGSLGDLGPAMTGFWASYMARAALERSQENHVVESGQDSTVNLEASSLEPATISDTQDESILADNILSLKLTCRTIHTELLHHRQQDLPNRRGLDLYLSYPTGVCVVANRYPHLLHMAKNVRIAGIFEAARAPCAGEVEKDLQETELLQEEHSVALRKLTMALLGKKTVERADARDQRAEQVRARKRGDKAWTMPWNTGTASTPIQPRSAGSPIVSGNEGHTTDSNGSQDTSAAEVIDNDNPSTRPNPKQPSPPGATNAVDPTSPTLHLRIFHPQIPNGDVYRQVWENRHSPVPVALPCVYGGVLENRIARGRSGTGVELIAMGNRGRSRHITVRHPSQMRDYSAKAWLLDRAWEVEG